MAEEVIKTKKQKKDYIYAVGRRREAVARIRLYASPKEGLVWGEQKITKDQILVNGKPIEHYFSGPVAKKAYMQPFVITNTIGKYAVSIAVNGGGLQGQLIAVINGLARALSIADVKKFRPVLKDKGFLTRDARVRERRKVGTGGKARRAKQSPKR